MRTAVLAIALGVGAVGSGGAARADDGPVRVRVEVGKTVERAVGIAIGVHCDDTAIVAAEMRTQDARTNVLVLTGLREGQTLCRAGTDPAGPSTLFEVHVVKRGSARR